MEKVHVLVQEPVQDEQAVGPGRHGGQGSEGASFSHPDAVSLRVPRPQGSEDGSNRWWWPRNYF